MLLLLGACALQKAPTGGEDDVTPPEVLVTAPPNFSTKFNSQEIFITFDEYVQVQNFSSQVIVSPPLKKKPEYTLKGRTLILTLEDTLLENTTYTFSFGTAISDITEGNVQSNFKYVVSTGEFLDSMTLAGNITDAYSGAPIEGALALIYPEDAPDSAIFNDLPLYYAVTKENGDFLIENIKDGRYRGFALEDKDNNYLLSSPLEKAGFSNLALEAGSSELSFRLFNEKGEAKFLNIRQKRQNQFVANFSNVPDTFNIYYAGSQDPIVRSRFEEATISDTNYFWVDSLAEQGNVEFLVDWTVNGESHLDTSKVFARVEDEAPSWKKVPLQVGKITPDKPVGMLSNAPLNILDSSKILWVDQGDTSRAQFDLLSAGKQLVINSELSLGEIYATIYYPGALSTLYGDTLVDTMIHRANVLTEEELSIFNIKINSTSNSPLLFEFLTDIHEDPIFSDSFFQFYEARIPNLEPGKYMMRIVIDENKNGVWDTGDLLGKQQPEPIIYYQQEIELRANWEIALTWNVKP
ncbi:MAG: Ig-like domain-containing protein [Schleiferiaceae bacterium]